MLRFASGWKSLASRLWARSGAAPNIWRSSCPKRSSAGAASSAPPASAPTDPRLRGGDSLGGVARQLGVVPFHFAAHAYRGRVLVERHVGPAQRLAGSDRAQDLPPVREPE